ncbi:hypothetical protein CC85DRAFT_281739 [Cutaneotrichosporon oleaginosum]|uniref:Uncharacterized protein n=1 Tax=Cutaneotrichosporon oleaginosum TaxID=879819 RepID=A0A0J0XYH1_9TREE|nr:uncharacterized protein CC85DRAFT_281739 [Cutaneotrichosporon oleaginosum]KLT46100.1 hypothetical protein CC85DRAFT_281739 [Cutaneotrichosporon oleaginosum]TXT10112.1 hypothetical protein COLE_04046 [Cutaneotrichosporon oleaginosum]
MTRSFSLNTQNIAGRHMSLAEDTETEFNTSLGVAEDFQHYPSVERTHGADMTHMHGFIHEGSSQHNNFVYAEGSGNDSSTHIGGPAFNRPDAATFASREPYEQPSAYHPHAGVPASGPYQVSAPAAGNALRHPFQNRLDDQAAHDTSFRARGRMSPLAHQQAQPKVNGRCAEA